MDEKPLKLKELEYPNFWVGTSRLVYAVFDGARCVFSGLTRGGTSTSTINAAERIIELIAQREEINPYGHRWFDLQTNKGYGGGHDCPHLGEFEFDELVFTPNKHRGLTETVGEDGQPVTILGTPEAIHVTDWHMVPCPPEVIAAFAVHIGDLSQPAYQCANPMTHDPNRPHPSDPHAQARNVHPDVLPLFDSIEQASRERLRQPGRRSATLERQIDADWVKLRALLESGRFVTPQTVISLEMVMMSLRRWDAVEFLNRHMLRLLPGSTESLCTLGSTLERIGKYREAEEVFEEAVEASERIFRKVGVDLDALYGGSVEVGTAAASKVSVLMLDVGDFYTRLAGVQLRQRKLREARLSAERAQRLHTLGKLPKSEPWRIAAEVLVRQGRSAEAQVALRQCIAVHREQERSGDYLDDERVGLLSDALEQGRQDLVKLLDDLDAKAQE